ncbi:FG-GAP-like repeat-containing protein [Hymenobacter sp. DH14]|uniref:FG-GAP-like repeat-containing protein n=1 Tax=Hymenobacter cyanobacteriorum TaxID=2926463 RepID=A0A9X2AJ62_9BACT|nr:FG-GAP-like repeat-containing protein [Hymenobacter cyanobacteriorum]MCI1188424.1 FG-GAP-like repeat-containing protein [Hymenobacter cyanobacteriorum]
MKHVSTLATNYFAGLAWGGALLLALLVVPVGAARAQASSFAPVVSYTSGVGILSAPHGVAQGDLNGDGLLDIVTANFYAGMVGVLLGTPGGSFAPVVAYPAGGGLAYEVAVGDLNGDGRPDIVVTNGNLPTASVLLGQGGGTFAAAVPYATGANGSPNGLALGDVNNDGRLDLVVTNYNTGTAGVLLGQAGGTFAAVVQYATGAAASQPIGVALGDLNGDGWLDIVAATSTLNTSAPGPPVGLAAVLLGQGGGRFAVPVEYQLSGINSRSLGVALGDVNGDGQLDIVGGNGAGNAVGVLLGLGGGTFASATQYAAGANSAPQSVALGDVNGDGQLDIVSGNYLSGTAGVLLGTGLGNFAPMVHFAAGSALVGLTLGDANGDGKLDIITTNESTYSAGVLLNTTVYEPPTLRSVSPANSPVGFSITLTGTYLSSVRAVRFNGTAATTFAVVNATTVTATVPPGATSGPVTVTTPGGTAAGVSFLVSTPSAALGARPADVALAPNPTHDAFTVTLPAGFGPVASAELLNALGQVVRRQAPRGLRFRVETSGLAPGLYTLRLQAGGTALARRVVVE